MFFKNLSYNFLNFSDLAKLFKPFLLPIIMDEKEELLKNLGDHAESNGFRLNFKQKIVKGIIEGLINNKKLYGEYYCPCKLKKEKENICPCLFHKNEIKKFGKCFCGLFIQK